MGGWIDKNSGVVRMLHVSSLYGRVDRVTPLLNKSMYSFLPVWEGGSALQANFEFVSGFPPCMGGWIGEALGGIAERPVSSLYGRVDRSNNLLRATGLGFLPVWEGGSEQGKELRLLVWFPPCMGGWIESIQHMLCTRAVSSLLGGASSVSLCNCL